MVRSVGSSHRTRRRGFAPRRLSRYFTRLPRRVVAHTTPARTRVRVRTHAEILHVASHSRARVRASPWRASPTFRRLPPRPGGFACNCAGKHPQEATMSFAVSASAACSAAVGARALKVRPPFIRVALRVVLARGECSIPGLRLDPAAKPTTGRGKVRSRSPVAHPALLPDPADLSKRLPRAIHLARTRGRRPRRRLRRHG